MEKGVQKNPVVFGNLNGWRRTELILVRPHVVYASQGSASLPRTRRLMAGLSQLERKEGRAPLTSGMIYHPVSLHGELCAL